MYPKALLAFLITFLLLFTTLASPALNVRQDEGVTMFDDGDTSDTEDASESQETTTVTSTVATATAEANGTIISSSAYTYVVTTRDPYQIWFYQHRRTLWCGKTCCNFHIQVDGAYAVGAPEAVIWSGLGCTGDYTVLDCGAVYLYGTYRSMSQF